MQHTIYIMERRRRDTTGTVLHYTQWNELSTNVLWWRSRPVTPTEILEKDNKMDLGSHFNPVQANQIWAETLKKEKACLKFSENFRVNPKAISRATVPPKPCQVDPFALAEKLRTTDPSQDSAADPEIEQIMKASMRPPQESLNFLWPALKQLVGRGR